MCGLCVCVRVHVCVRVCARVCVCARVAQVEDMGEVPSFDRLSLNRRALLQWFALRCVAIDDAVGMVGAVASLDGVLLFCFSSLSVDHQFCVALLLFFFSLLCMSAGRSPAAGRGWFGVTL